MRFLRPKHLEAEEIERRLLVMKTSVEGRLRRLEARLLKRRQALEKALSEFRKTLEHLEALAQEGRYPRPYLDPALERERLRIQHAEKELKALLEGLASTRARLLSEARRKGARLGAKEEQIAHFFAEEVAGGSVAHG